VNHIKDKTIIVTGGFGFIGQHVVEKLLNLKAKRIIILDSLDYGSENKTFLSDNRIHFHKIKLGSVSEEEIVNQISGADYCIHLAAEKSKSKNIPDNILKCNVNGTYVLLNALIKAGVKKIIFSSSLYVYGKTNKNGFNEKDVFNPHTIFGVTKCAGESLLKFMSQKYDLNYVCLRYFFVYGPKQYQGTGYKSVIIKNFQQLLSNKSPVVFGNGQQIQDHVYIDDVVNATIKSLENQYVNVCYNIGSNDRCSINDLIKKMMKIENKSINIEYKDADETHNTVRFNNSTKALEDGLLEIKTDLNKGLKLTLDWIKTQ
jgi:UDP-glucose 4-epimerase